MVCDENDCHYKMSGNPAGTVTYWKPTLWFCMHSLCALLFGEIALRNYLSLITCWQAVLNSDKACFTNEIRAAFQPFNILNVHYQEKAENLFLSSQLQTSTGIRILTCKALSPLQIQKLLFHAICLLVFFICFNVFSLFISLLFCVSIFCSLERERWKKRIYCHAVLSAPYMRCGLSCQVGVLSAAFAHCMTLLLFASDTDS